MRSNFWAVWHSLLVLEERDWRGEGGATNSKLFEDGVLCKSHFYFGGLPVSIGRGYTSASWGWGAGLRALGGAAGDCVLLLLLQDSVPGLMRTCKKQEINF